MELKAYYLNWTGEFTRCTYEAEDGSQLVMFEDYTHNRFGHPPHVAAVMQRILGFYMGRACDRDTLRRFMATRPSLVVVTRHDLEDFFGETALQAGLRI